MTKREKYLLIYDRLFALYGKCSCPLKHDSPFQLLVAVMLSAQCRDDRVNVVTEELFAIAPDAKTMAELPEEVLEKIIHPCGLSGAKSRNIRQSAQLIISQYNGQVPDTMEELVKLPGVGRKSANVLLGDAFDKPGFPVDTHVKRLLNLLGTVKSDSPEFIEKDLNRNVPPELWSNFSHLLIRHGRAICNARKPDCSKCVLNDICKNKRS